MQVLGFTIDELRRLMATRSVLLKMLQTRTADQDVIAWVKRGGPAEVIRLDDFPGRSAEVVNLDDFRPGAPAQMSTQALNELGIP